jgi:DNA/RNA endonuclease YhcR with UshA esterase domain
MLQKEEKITIILMVMALLVLIIAYFGFIVEESEPLTYSNRTDIGDQVEFQGDVVGKRSTFTGNHLMLTVDSEGSLIKVFIHRNNGADQVNRSVDVTDTVKIIGVVDEYEGEREIVVKSPQDIRVVKE